MRRYAIYYAPEAGSNLWDFGCRWLGRDAAADAPVERRHLPGLDPDRQAEITRSAARYGLHGTLKPPFALAEGASEAALDAAVAAFAARQSAFETAPMAIGSLGGFLALMPRAPAAKLRALADACVEALDGFRAPPTAAEVARRRTAGLTPRQEGYLVRWGYPYVFEDFRFHMTLTCRLDPAERARVLAALIASVGSSITALLAVASVCLFTQAGAVAPFVLRGRYAFAS